MILGRNFFTKEYYYGKKSSNYSNYDIWDNDRFWKKEINYIKKYKMRGRLLDVGCAFGFFLKRATPFFSELHGVDISFFALEKAKEQVPSAKLYNLDLNNEEIPMPDSYFDLITAFDVLEHTESIENSLVKLNRKLKKGGYLIITLPIKDTWAGQIMKLFDKDISHISVPSKKELFLAVSKNRLQIIEKSYFFNAGYVKLSGIPVDIELVLRK